jgi:hypothetical protein
VKTAVQEVVEIPVTDIQGRLHYEQQGYRRLSSREIRQLLAKTGRSGQVVSKFDCYRHASSGDWLVVYTQSG